MNILSIRTKAPLAISIPLILSVGLIGWVAFYNARRTVDELTLQISQELGEQIEERVDHYLQEPELINRSNTSAIEIGDADVQNLRTFERRLWHQMQIFKGVSGIEFGSQQTGAGTGIVRSNDGSLAYSVTEAAGEPQIYYEVVARGKRGQELNRTPNYDSRKRPWFKAAAQAGKPTWTRPNLKFSTKQLRISSVHPVYEPETGQLLGVLSVDFFLSEISKFLHTIKAGKSGVVFIVEPSGEIIATSREETLFTVEGEEARRIKAFDSKDPLIRDSAQAVQAQLQSFAQLKETHSLRFSQRGEAYLTYINRFNRASGLDWLIVVVLPEKDFMQRVEETTRFTAIMGAGVLLFSILLGALVTRWLVSPILQLSKAADEIKTGAFQPETLNDISQRTDEIGQMAKVFREMAEVVQSREQSLQDQVQQLVTETDKVKKSAMAMQLTNGRVNPQLLLERSRQVRQYAETRRQNLAELLHQVSYFQSFTSAEIQRLISLGYEQHMKVGEFICREGEAGDKFFIILSGSVEVYLESLKKQLGIRQPGDFLGELSLLLGIPRTATVRTVEPTTLFVVDQKGFQILLRDYPGLGEQVALKINERQAELQQRKEELRKHGLLDDEAMFSGNFFGWTMKRMRTIFGTQGAAV